MAKGKKEVRAASLEELVQHAVSAGVGAILEQHPRFKGMEQYIGQHLDATKIQGRVKEVYTRVAQEQVSDEERAQKIYTEIVNYVAAGEAFDDAGKETKIIIQSNRMKIYYKYIEKLFKKQAIYVCTCTQETFKTYVEAKKNCPCREQTEKENLNLWKKMLDKNKKTQLKEGEAVARFRSSMQDPNPAFRDFPLARISETLHPQQKKKYRVWPLMNLAVAVDDIELKMTHIIRAKDHRDNAARQEMIFKALGKKYPWRAFLGRYKFTDIDLSKRAMRQAVEQGRYTGWDDSRLPTIASLRKQGYKPKAFEGLAIRVGLSENDKVMNKKEYFELLDYFNR